MKYNIKLQNLRQYPFLFHQADESKSKDELLDAERLKCEKISQEIEKVQVLVKQADAR